MLFGLKYITDHGVNRLHEAFGHFIMSGCDNATFGRHCFPEWFSPVFRGCTRLRELSKTVWRALRASTDDLAKVQTMWRALADIEALCSDPTVNVTFDVPSSSTMGALRALADYLYDDCLHVKCCQTACGNIYEHYTQFRKECAAVCAFCGLEFYPDLGSGYRAAYDHYLCRRHYPLLAVCFRNLVPICGTCNEAPQKGSKDILRSADGSRRKAYFPFGKVGGIRISITWISKPSLGVQGVCKMSLEPSDPTEAEQVTTWLMVYRITERASARLQSHYDNWMKSILRQRRFTAKPSIADLRELFRTEARALCVEATLRQEIDALYKSGVFAYLAECAPDSELEGIASIATSRAILVPTAIR